MSVLQWSAAVAGHLVAGGLLGRLLLWLYGRYVRGNPRHPLGWVLWFVSAVWREEGSLAAEVFKGKCSRERYVLTVIILWPARLAWVPLAPASLCILAAGYALVHLLAGSGPSGTDKEGRS